MPNKHILIRGSNGMMRLVDNNQPRCTAGRLQLVNVPGEPLYGENPDSYFCLQHHFLFPINQAETVQRLLHLFHQFTAMCHNPHLTLIMIVKEPFYYRRHHIGLSRTRRHLYHHRMPQVVFPLLGVVRRCQRFTRQDLYDVI